MQVAVQVLLRVGLSLVNGYCGGVCGGCGAYPVAEACVEAVFGVPHHVGSRFRGNYAYGGVNEQFEGAVACAVLADNHVKVGSGLLDMCDG